MSASETLKVLHGEKAERLTDVLSALFALQPEIVWCEPTPARKRLPSFPGLWIKDWATLRKHLQEKTALDEARLFWKDGWVHLLSVGDEVRWAAFHEGAEPEWLRVLGAENPQAWQCSRCLPHDILLLSDLNRYGLPDLEAKLTGKLQVVEYRQGTNLVGWRLEVKS